MHTKLPDFYTKAEAAAKKNRPDMEYSISGLENVKTAKLASLRVGRVEDEISELTEDEDVSKIEVVLTPDNPEVLYTVVIRALDKDGGCKKVILEEMMLTVPTVETQLFDAKEIIDRRAELKK